MIKAGGVLKMIDEEKVMMDFWVCLRHVGADIILTYFALQAARALCGEKKRGRGGLVRFLVTCVFVNLTFSL